MPRSGNKFKFFITSVLRTLKSSQYNFVTGGFGGSHDYQNQFYRATAMTANGINLPFSLSQALDIDA
jgi:hypothetical protein